MTPIVGGYVKPTTPLLPSMGGEAPKPKLLPHQLSFPASHVVLNLAPPHGTREVRHRTRRGRQVLHQEAAPADGRDGPRRQPLRHPPRPQAHHTQGHSLSQAATWW